MVPKNCNSHPDAILKLHHKSGYGFKTAQKFHKFKSLYQNSEIFSAALKACSDCHLKIAIKNFAQSFIQNQTILLILKT